MSLTIVTNPVTGSKGFFAGFDKIEFVFKREDIAVSSVDAGTGGARINHSGDLTSYLSVGDTVYLYSEGTNYTYDLSAEIIAITAGQITLDTPFIESATGGYANYFKNYYVEMQLVNASLTDVSLLPFNLQSDGDPAGNIIIDVSIINDFNRRRGLISEGLIEESSREFKVKYKQVYDGSSESFTLLSGNTLIALYCTQNPETDTILNNFDLPKIYKGYPALIAIARNGKANGTIKLSYETQNINKVGISSSDLTDLDGTFNGFINWLWAADKSVEPNTKYILFSLTDTIVGDFAAPDFAAPDFVIT